MSNIGDLNLFGERAVAPVAPLADRFVAPPMTVLDTRQGYWMARRTRWVALGIRSELGRGETAGGVDTDAAGHSRLLADKSSNLTGAPPLPEWANNGMAHVAPGTSIFDPVLAEALYRWHCPPGGSVVDPFAGGSVRGVVAAQLGLSYTGVELRAEQVDSNRRQVDEIWEHAPASRRPSYIVGDAYDALGDMPHRSFDYLMTCPPYADLEVYSDDPADLSVIASADYHAFVSRYAAIIARASRVMADHSFASVVIQNVRDKRGHLRDLVGDTVRAFAAAGLEYYNEAVLINQVGTGAMRASRQFDSGRKLVRCHQSVVTFVKGDARSAVKKMGSRHLCPDIA